MIRPVLLLATVVLALGALDFLLASRETRARVEERRVGALFTPEAAGELRKLPALRVELDGATHAYGRIEGRWRCLSLFGAPADGAAVQELIDGIVRAEGLVFARTVAEAPAFGINVPATIRVALQGPRAVQQPGGDVRATLEIGLSRGDGTGCFVRRLGTPEIWSIATDLRAPLERRVAPGLPPLLEPAAVGGAWLAASGGLVRVTIERGGASEDANVVLERRDRPLDPAEMQPGDLPWTWVLDPAGRAAELDAQVADAFTGFLERLPYAGVLDPERREAELGPPAATITLTPRTGAPLALVLGSRTSGGRVALWVAESGTLYQLEASIAALVAPAAAELTAEHGASDPWSATLRARSGGMETEQR